MAFAGSREAAACKSLGRQPQVTGNQTIRTAKAVGRNKRSAVPASRSGTASAGTALRLFRPT